MSRISFGFISDPEIKIKAEPERIGLIVK